MATDEELLIYNTLNDNWNTANAPLPKIYYDDTISVHDFRNFPAIKLYTINVIEAPKNLGYTGYSNKVYISIDIRANNRTWMLQERDEVKRIIRSFRKTLTGYDLFQKVNERKVASYINYFQYIIETELLKYRTTI